MAENHTAPKETKLLSDDKSERFSRITSAIENVKGRSENCRGPFIISEEDLNSNFSLDN